MTNTEEFLGNENGFSQYLTLLSSFLRDRKLHMTSERRAILNAIYLYNGHFTIDELLIFLKKNKYHVSRSTLYNNINLLLDAGLIAKYQFQGQEIPLYEKCLQNRNHNHIYNTDNHNIMEFSDKRIEEIISDIEKKHKVKISHHNFVVYCHSKNETDCKIKNK